MKQKWRIVKIKAVDTAVSPIFLAATSITSFFLTRKLIAPKPCQEKIKIIEKPVSRSLLPAGFLFTTVSLISKDIARAVVRNIMPPATKIPEQVSEQHQVSN